MSEIPLNPIQNCIEGLVRKEEAAVRRMLCAWDPAWGEPAIAQRAASPKDYLTPQPGKPGVFRAHSQIVGLCEAGVAIHEIGQIKIWLTDHIDDQGNVLQPIPDRGQLAIFERRLRS